MRIVFVRSSGVSVVTKVDNMTTFAVMRDWCGMPVSIGGTVVSWCRTDLSIVSSVSITIITVITVTIVVAIVMSIMFTMVFNVMF
jgi:hypothetical protein